MKQGAQWVSDKVKAGVEGVKNWANKTFGGGGSAGDPNNWNHRDKLLENVQNGKLRNAIEQLYRKSAEIGDGGTADMLRHEFDSGLALDHLQKAQDMIRALNNILTEQKLTPEEIKLAYQLLNDLHGAVKYVTK